MSSDDRRAFFSRLESHYDALFMVRDTANAFFVVAALQALTAAAARSPDMVPDVVMNAVGAFALRRWRSRAAAVVLLAMAMLTLGLLLFGLVNQGRIPPVALIVALLTGWAGVRATEATFKLRGSLSADAPQRQPPDTL